MPLYPLTGLWGNGAVWAFLGAFSLMIALMPWLPPLRRAKAAAIDLDHCNGCARCAEDCPYEAIKLVPRTDKLPFPTQAEVNPSLCVSCGICVGSSNRTPSTTTIRARTLDWIRTLPSPAQSSEPAPLSAFRWVDVKCGAWCGTVCPTRPQSSN